MNFRDRFELFTHEMFLGKYQVNNRKEIINKSQSEFENIWKVKEEIKQTSPLDQKKLKIHSVRVTFEAVNELMLKVIKNCVTVWMNIEAHRRQ